MGRDRRRVGSDVRAPGRRRRLARALPRGGPNATDIEEAVSNSLRVDVGPPQSVKRPKISGTPITGQTLTCDPGEWSRAADFTYQWYTRRLLPCPRFEDIPGATDSTYRLRPSDDLQPGDGGKEIGCLVTADERPRVELDAERDRVRRRRLPFNDRAARDPARPRRAEPGRPGHPLSLRPVGRGLLGPRDPRLRVRGAVAAQRRGHPGRDGTQYDTTPDDLGKGLRCQVIAKNPAGRSGPAASAEYLVPLPRIASPGRMLVAQGKNQFVPTNLLAIGAEFDIAVQRYAQARLQEAVEADQNRCYAIWGTDRRERRHEADARASSGSRSARSCAAGSTGTTARTSTSAPTGSGTRPDEGGYYASTTWASGSHPSTRRSRCPIDPQVQASARRA